MVRPVQVRCGRPKGVKSQTHQARTLRSAWASRNSRILDCGSSVVWVYRLGAEKAKRMLFTGDKVTGIEAAALGLVLQAVPADRLDDEWTRSRTGWRPCRRTSS